MAPGSPGGYRPAIGAGGPSPPRVPDDGTPPNQLPPTAAAVVFAVLAAAGFGSIYGGSALLSAASFQPAGPGGSYDLVAFLYGTQVTGAALLAVFEYRYRQAWISVSARGIEVGSAASRWEAAWDSLGSVAPPRGTWAALTVRPAGGAPVRSLFVTRAQLRAILAHSTLAPGRFPPEYWEWAGAVPPAVEPGAEATPA